MEKEEPVTPAEFLRQQLEQRGLSQADLAFVLDVPVQSIGQIALGRRGISADMAAAMAAVFEVPADYILKLQKASEVAPELSRARRPNPSIARKAKLVATYPVREMLKRGWLADDATPLDDQVARFFHVKSLEDVPHLDHAAKKSDYSHVPPAQLAWLFRVQEIAREIVVPRYTEQGLREALPKLQALMSAPEEARHVPRLLAECGVRFVIVQTLPTAKIDGVCFWVDADRSPVVAMSIRFDRIDNFWFVLRHELEHVLKEHGRGTPMIDADLEEAAKDDALPLEERQANDAAREFCVPKSQMDSWIARKAPFFSERDLVGFAARVGVHPGIVAGQLRNRTGNYKMFARYLAKVQVAVTPSAIVDGWGQVAPVSD